jgi:NADH dehydrogenase [ubiquinone] 1 alpha subcomplex assembly factor 7
MAFASHDFIWNILHLAGQAICRRGMSSAETVVRTLGDRLVEKIRREGSISVADYMNAAAKEYYAQGDVFGRRGDFITAPEISQTFGEIIGLWCVVVWQNMGSPRPCRLIECGPGRGTLMADALRAAGPVPGFLDALDVHLIEQSSALRDLQREKLEEQSITWHERLDTCPNGPTILIGNEFLDALPIRQLEKTTTGWVERRIGLDESNHFHFTLHDSVEGVSDAPSDADTGAIYETSPAIGTFVTDVAARILRHGGAALFIDYGHKKSAVGETLQAVQRHQPHLVLEAPGTADITAHVDFEAAAKAAQDAGAKVYGPIDQGNWLKQLGITVRGALLAKEKAPDVARDIESGIRRLTEPDAMGALFKVIALTHPDLKPPEGFTQ